MKNNQPIHFVFLDSLYMKLYKFEGKKLNRTTFKVSSTEKVERIYYSYDYSLENDMICYYPLEIKGKNIVLDRTYYGNVIDINLLWRGFFENIIKYLPKMGKLYFVTGKLNGLGNLNTDLRVRLKLHEDLKNIFKDRFIGLADFPTSVFSFLVTLNRRYNKNVVLLANTFCMICGEGMISTTYYTKDKMVEEYAKQLDISDLFYSKYEINKIVEDLLMDYLSFNEYDYVVERQNQTIRITMDRIKEQYDTILSEFVSSISKYSTDRPMYIIDVTSKDNRLVMDLLNILKTSPYDCRVHKYSDFIEDSIIYSYLVTTKNTIKHNNTAMKLYLIKEEFLKDEDKVLKGFTDGLNLYTLEFFMSEKSANSLLGEYIKKIKFEE